MFEEQEKVNDTIMKLQIDQIMADVNETRKLLARLAENTSSPVALERSRLAAEANAGKILLSARRLYSRGLYDQDAAFVRQAISTYEKIGLQQSRTFPSLKMQLADCLIKQQMFEAVRPLLVSALEMRRALPDQGSTTVKRQVAESLLRLGQFDRDQSNFKEAHSELSAALEMVRKDFASDKDFMREALQSYADLLRQTGKLEESKRISREATDLH
jgi:tetratricopeptide (TPR) repeat protein